MVDEQIERKRYLVTEIKHNTKRIGISTAKGTGMLVGATAIGYIVASVLNPAFGWDVNGIGVGLGIGIGNNLLAPFRNRKNWDADLDNDFLSNVISLAVNIKSYVRINDEIKTEEKVRKLW